MAALQMVAVPAMLGGGTMMEPAEVRHVCDTARRLAALLLLGPDLDANCRACAAAPDDLNARSSGGGTAAGGQVT